MNEEIVLKAWEMFNCQSVSVYDKEGKCIFHGDRSDPEYANVDFKLVPVTQKTDGGYYVNPITGREQKCQNISEIRIKKEVADG